MQKYKYLLKNVGLLTISNFGTKILSFLLIPIYTSILSTADYGLYDIYSTTVSLLIPLLTLNIVEGVMRFSLDKGKEAPMVFSIGFKIVFKAGVILTVLATINRVFGIIPVFKQYWIFLILLFWGSTVYDLLSQFSRGIERIADVAVAGAINSVTMLALNVLFLVRFRFGLWGYFAANCCAYYAPIVYSIFRLKIWKYVIFKENKPLQSEMSSYSTPLVFNTVAWWINNVSDRYIVTWMAGVAANGVYSVSYKIPSILNIFQSIFSQAWTLSAVKEFNDGNEFYSKVYRVYNCGMVMVCSCLILADRIVARILFSGDFFTAWKYAPFLMISVVFGAMSGMLGGIFSASKDSTIFAKTTLIGAAINTVLNVVLVYMMGPLGAAISTEVAYVFVWSARYRAANKIVEVKTRIKRDAFSYVVLNVQAVLWLISQSAMMYIVQVVFVGGLLLIYIDDIKEAVVPVIKKVKE